MIAAFIAASCMFISCADDTSVLPEIPIPAASPSIRFYFGGVEQQNNATKTVKVGDVVNVIVNYAAPGQIGQIDFKVGDASDPAKTSGFQTTTIDEISKEITFEAEGTVVITTTILDKQSPTLQASFTMTITVEPNTTPLSIAKEFTLTYVSASQTNGANENKDIGIKYAVNTNATTARFEIIATTNKFVPLTKAAFDAIKVKEVLAETYNQKVGAEGVESFTRQSDANFQAYYFISKVGDRYFLIEMKSLKFSPGNNQAVFAYQE